MGAFLKIVANGYALLTLISLTGVLAFLCADAIRTKRIESFFKKMGYRRKFLRHSDILNVSYYGWVKEKPEYKLVEDLELNGMSVKKIKEKYRNT